MSHIGRCTECRDFCKRSKLSDEDRGLVFMGVMMLVFHTKMCHNSVLLVFEEAHFISNFDLRMPNSQEQAAVSNHDLISAPAGLRAHTHTHTHAHHTCAFARRRTSRAETADRTNSVTHHIELEELAGKRKSFASREAFSRRIAYRSTERAGPRSCTHLSMNSSMLIKLSPSTSRLKNNVQASTAPISRDSKNAFTASSSRFFSRSVNVILPSPRSSIL